jgi:IS5 family transposase
MLRTRNEQPSLWESVLPEVCLRLPAELERVDEWLDDERFFAPFAPFVPYFSARKGRPPACQGELSPLVHSNPA